MNTKIELAMREGLYQFGILVDDELEKLWMVVRGVYFGRYGDTVNAKNYLPQDLKVKEVSLYRVTLSYNWITNLVPEILRDVFSVNFPDPDDEPDSFRRKYMAIVSRVEEESDLFYKGNWLTNNITRNEFLKNITPEDRASYANQANRFFTALMRCRVKIAKDFFDQYKSDFKSYDDAFACMLEYWTKEGLRLRQPVNK